MITVRLRPHLPVSAAAPRPVYSTRHTALHRPAALCNGMSAAFSPSLHLEWVYFSGLQRECQEIFAIFSMMCFGCLNAIRLPCREFRGRSLVARQSNMAAPFRENLFHRKRAGASNARPYKVFFTLRRCSLAAERCTGEDFSSHLCKSLQTFSSNLFCFLPAMPLLQFV